MERVIELLQSAKAGDKTARETLVKENIGLVWSIVRRFGQRGYEFDDLFQIGTIGLMKAIDYFDLSYGVKFSTYACPMISGEIRRFLRDDSMIKVSRTIKDQQAKLRKAQEMYFITHGKEATPAKLSELTGIPLEEVIIALDVSVEIDSLQKVVYQGEHNEICLMDRIEDPKDESEQVVNQMLLRELIAKLPEMEKNIIILRYYCNQTQSQIAKRLGISQVQVSRIEKRILNGMKKEVQR
jgi:RNA polymerase sporulation-specific sigma factor